MKRSIDCLIVVCFFGLLFSCKKEDTGSLVGIWKATRIETKNCTKASDDRILELGANDCTVVSNIEYCVTIKYALNSDGTYQYYNTTKIAGFPFSETKNGTYTVSGNKLTLCENNGSCSDGTFTVSSTTLTVNSKDSSSGCDSNLRFQRQ